MRIEQISIYQLSIPLANPYHLAFGPVHAFDTVLVELLDDDGTPGLGEATLLAGYTDETLAGSWQLAQQIARRIAGTGSDEAKHVIDASCAQAPFTATAFITALEMIEQHPLLQLPGPARVPILGIVHGNTPEALQADIENNLEQGYRTLKVKVGFDANADLERVAVIQRILAGRAQIRIDANQGYSRAAAIHFVSRLDPAGIELFEQPCAAGDWESACAVAEVAAVPMMLDESIYGLDDISRAAQLKAASFIKLKLMKMGGLSHLEEGLLRIRQCGLEPVLGNGVATELGCWMEACVARQLIRNDGEMNGFLKPRVRLLREPLEAAGGAIALRPDFRAALNQQALRACLRDKHTFHA